ncbi:GNAT family N-acetyltransferase, partial [Candidatus Bathyarchaeota archaeon]|nr:GNAT family N-acetyltransferase [Candidatus Bathyarchaeota archaeon]
MASEPDLVIDTDKGRLDIEYIHRFLSGESHWARSRTMEQVKKSIENSLCFGAYKDGEQIGFARVVTDYTTFSWLCDVFIDPEHRGHGYGKRLVEAVVECPPLRDSGLMLLATRFSPSLYRDYGGFTPLGDSWR